MVEDVTIPFAFLSVASVQSVVKCSLDQLGHAELPGELPMTSGTAMHDIMNRGFGFTQANSPMQVSKLLAYFFYDK